MAKYEEIAEARKIFGINESETIGEIKRKINALVKKWHPDTGREKGGEGKEKTILLIKAKKTIMDYCDNYKISFCESEVDKYLSANERWMKNFGHDHVWGGGTGK